MIRGSTVVDRHLGVMARRLDGDRWRLVLQGPPVWTKDGTRYELFDALVDGGMPGPAAGELLLRVLDSGA